MRPPDEYTVLEKLCQQQRDLQQRDMRKSLIVLLNEIFQLFLAETNKTRKNSKQYLRK